MIVALVRLCQVQTRFGICSSGEDAAAFPAGCCIQPPCRDLLPCAAWGCSGCWELSIQPGCSPLSLSLQLPEGFQPPATQIVVFGVKRQLVLSSELCFGCLGLFLHPGFPSLGVFGSKRQLYPRSGFNFVCLSRVFTSRTPYPRAVGASRLLEWGDALLARWHWSSALDL